MDRFEAPDGYRLTGRGPEVELIDPAWCPTGHPVEQFRRGFTQCTDWEHQGHTYWMCSCGQDIYRAPGAFVGEPLACMRKLSG
jgi:hypothetical protein